MMKRQALGADYPLGGYLYSPEKEPPDLPLIVFLHGAGERGTNTEHLLRHGIPRLITEEGREYNAYILVPQCPATYVWNNMVREVKASIDRVVSEKGILPDRITVTGCSMGGYGTWEMGLTYRSFFAAIAPVAGGGMPWRCPCLRATPVYAYHGGADPVVVPDCSRAMVHAVNAAGGSASLRIIEGLDHNEGIEAAYRDTDLVDRLLAARRTDFTYIPDICEEMF